jgi:hypothetical protein
MELLAVMTPRPSSKNMNFALVAKISTPLMG